MPKVDTYTMDGKKKGSITLSDDIFGIAPNAAAMHQVVTAQLANRRQGTQSALTRAEVRGGGIKPWRQKGTGRARQGSTRSPQWRKGGVVFAPKPRSYAKSVNKKVRRLAMKSALSSKVLSGDIIVLDDLALSAPKTKDMVQMLSALNVDGKALIVMPEGNENIELSARNIPGVKTTLTGTLSVYEILNYGKFIITKDAVKKVEEVYA
ncbi:50S ribosomal protein L4 [Eubacteriales bacterium OttesenSCG-928-N14]|nr:50S ribosomal protein L4 [Eubacteriales bacterium OttesenSCG-928-N14]